MTREQLQVEYNLVKQKIEYLKLKKATPGMIRSAEIVLKAIEEKLNEEV